MRCEAASPAMQPPMMATRWVMMMRVEDGGSMIEHRDAPSTILYPRPVSSLQLRQLSFAQKWDDRWGSWHGRSERLNPRRVFWLRCRDHRALRRDRRQSRWARRRLR